MRQLIKDLTNVDVAPRKTAIESPKKFINVAGYTVELDSPISYIEKILAEKLLSDQVKRLSDGFFTPVAELIKDLAQIIGVDAEELYNSFLDSSFSEALKESRIEDLDKENQLKVRKILLKISDLTTSFDFEVQPEEYSNLLSVFLYTRAGVEDQDILLYSTEEELKEAYDKIKNMLE